MLRHSSARLSRGLRSLLTVLLATACGLAAPFAATSLVRGEEVEPSAAVSLDDGETQSVEEDSASEEEAPETRAAFADEPTLDAVMARLAALEQELARMKSIESEEQAPVESRMSVIESDFQHLRSQVVNSGVAAGRPRSTDLPPSLKTTTNPVYPTARLSGFFQLDAGYFAQDATSEAQFGNIQDDRGFRRARLAAVGDVSKNISYMIEMDFAQPGRPSFMDVWGDLHDVPLLGNIRVGQWRQPFGMDELTSVRELTFLERPTMFSLAPFRQVGIGFHDTNSDQTTTWAASVYGYPTDANFGVNVGDSGYGMSARVTHLFDGDCDPSTLWHIGGGISVNNPNLTGGGFTHAVRLAGTPEYGGPFFFGPGGTTASVPAFYDTGFVPANTLNLFNLELARVWGPLHAQSEMRWAVIESNNQGTIVIPAFYAQTGYLLTGEVRPYNKVGGVLGRIKPLHPLGEGGFGAFELAARYSYINYNQGNIPATVITPGALNAGGELSDFTVGINWYLTQYAKVQLDYIRAHLNRAPLGTSDTDIVGVRAQVDF